MRLKIAGDLDLETLKQHKVCVDCLKGDNGEEKPLLVFVTDSGDCPNHGPLAAHRTVNGALLYCFMMTLDLDSLAKGERA